MPSAPPDPVAALAALDDAAIAEATTAGLLAGDFKSEESSADAILIRYLERTRALARALPARDLLKANASADTLIERLREDDADDLLEECVDELVVIVIGPHSGGEIPDEATTEAAVLATEHIMTVAFSRLYHDVLRTGRSLRN